MRGDGQDVIRGGWGIYYDMGYTNANVLFPAVDATGIGFGSIFNVSTSTGILNPDGSFYRFGQPISNIASQNSGQHQPAAAVRPVAGSALRAALHAPDRVRLVAPADDEHRVHGRLRAQRGTRPRHARRDQRAPDQHAVDRAAPAARSSACSRTRIGTRGAISVGESEYNGLIMGVKRRMTRGFDLTATYTLADSKSNIGTAADELNQNNIQDVALLYDDPRTWGPTGRTDARHSGTLAACVR